MTLVFKSDGLNPIPGQFLMVWVPGVDEIPMSISSIDTDTSTYAITVAGIGDATKSLCEKQTGDLIGIRGPFGNGFSRDTPRHNACIIGGGVGMACVNPLVAIAKNTLEHFIVINAAKTKEELLFNNRYERELARGKHYYTSTDDGSCGEKCFGHELLERVIDEGRAKVEKVFACGPERMLVKVFETCSVRGIPLEASLERMMRCGNGLCGLCGMDPGGLLVCKDGPVFTGEQLKRVTEFGRYHRDFAGNKIDF